MPRGQLTIVEVALDETEVKMCLDSRSEVTSMLVLHATATVVRGDLVQKLEIVIPPAGLASTSAATILEALRQRLPISLHALMKSADKFLLILNTDSAKSCLKLGAHLQTLVPTLPAACRLHQVCPCKKLMR